MEKSIIQDYKDITNYRHSLNRLTSQCFGFDFEQWYQQGYWSDKYRPYSILHKNEIVANISVNPIDYLVNGRIIPTVQIGTVMTDKAYRNQGLSRELMNRILGEYENSCELIYLYANDSVREFYPKFGFTEAKEYVYSKQLIESGDKLSYRKLDLQDEKDKALITRLVKHALPVSKYTMVNNPNLMMFHLTSYMSGDIYYFEKLDLAAVVTWEEDHINLTDLFCEHEFDIEQIMNSLNRKDKCKIILGFTPKDPSLYLVEQWKEEGSTFFVKGTNFLKDGRLPVLSHA